MENLAEKIRQFRIRVEALLSDEEDPNEPRFDPLHLGAMVVLSLVGIGVLFWLFWALLVCEGGLFPKVIPFLRVLFTRKTLADYGWEGYPYELGVFEGFVVNVGALIVLILVLAGISYLFADGRRESK